MSGDLDKRHPQDASKISLTESWEVWYWCSELECTEAQLRAAVVAVDHSSAAVRRHFSK